MLPFGKSKTLNPTKQLFDQITAKAKSLDSFSVDNSTGTIALTFVTVNYDDYLAIKKGVESNGYFLISLPFKVTLSSNGICSCSVTLSWKDFTEFKGGDTQK